MTALHFALFLILFGIVLYVIRTPTPAVVAIMFAGLLIALVGCAAVPTDQSATCKIPVTRDAGMGVRLPDCVYWQFGKDFPQPTGG